jgi:signal transduction histidine kinase
VRRYGILVWPVALATGLAAEAIAYGWRDPTRWVPDLLVGWTFIACGLVATAKRPTSRSGFLTAATGLTWFLPNFAGLSGALGGAAASTLFWHRGPLVHLVLTHPEGRTRSPLTRAAIVVGYAAALVSPVWRSEAATVVIAAFLVVVSVRGYLGSVGPARRAYRFALVAAIALAILLAAEALVRLSGPSPAENSVLLLAYEVAIGAIALALTAGLLTAPWERADVTDIVVELGQARSGALQDRLSRALGDPTLEVGYWVADQGRFVDADGRALDAPDPDSGRSRTLLERDGEPIAVIVHDPSVLRDPGLVQAVSSAAKLGASNARLQADLRSRQAEIRASRRRILEAADEERSRLERRLHESVQGRLLELRSTLRQARTTADEHTATAIQKTEEQLARTQEDLRRFARGIHPPELAAEGLAGAFSTLAKDFPLPLDLTFPERRIPPKIESCAYFVCLEALTNVAKHARASRARVSVDRDGRSVTVIVEDDGVGGADPAGSGLRGLADRVETLNGTLRVQSPVGHGTHVTATIPVDAAM